MLNVVKLAFVLSSTTLLLAACGGGGGGGGTVTPGVVASFPLQAGYKAYAAAASTTDFGISGTCTGSAIVSRTAPSAAIFEGAAALASTSTGTITFTNCTPPSFVSTSIQYYDSNYNELGHLTPGSEYGKYLTLPAPLPVSVKVGDSGTYGTENLYTDSTKTTATGQSINTYVVEADGTSTTTAIINLLSREYNAASQLIITSQERYRIDGSGNLSIVSLDQQGSTTSTTHLVLTKR